MRSPMRKNKMLYSINVEDIQDVAMEELDRPLSNEELRLVEEKLGDYIDWYGAIVLSLNEID